MIYTIWTTTGCNLQCKYCYESEKKTQNMSLDIAEKTVKYILENQKECDQDFIVAFHGGEPFMNMPVIQYVIAELKRKYKENVSFAATTNGTLLDDEAIEFVGKNFDEISISIDGDEETHDALRTDAMGNGSHKKALESALKLLKYDPLLRIRMTFNHYNVNKLYSNVAFLVEKGFKCIAACENFYDSNWSDEDIDVLRIEIQKIKKSFGNKNFLISLCEPIRLYCLGECRGGENSLHILPNGKLYPCTLAGGISEFEIGDIEHGVNKRKVQQILSHAGLKHQECIGCALSTGCEGARCMIVNKIVMGKWDSAIPIQCSFNRLLYEINGIQ